MAQDKVLKLLKQVSTIDFTKEHTYTLSELKCLLSAYCKRELEEIEAFVINGYYDLPGTKLKINREEEKTILERVSNKFKHPYKADGFSYFIGLKKKELIHPVKPTIHLEQSVNDLHMPEMVTKKLIDSGILTVNQLVNLSTMELYKILKGHCSFLRWVYKVIGNNVVFDSVKNEDNTNNKQDTKIQENAKATAKKYQDAEILSYSKKIKSFIISKDEFDDWEY